MFLIVVAVHFLSCALHAGLVCLLPVWALTETQHGGLGYSPLECGLLASATGVMIFHILMFLRQRLIFVIRASPLRGLRVGSGSLVTASLLLPVLCNRVSKVGTMFLKRPNESLVGLVVPAILLAVIVCSARFCRRASSILLSIALGPSFHSPETLVSAISSLADMLVSFLHLCGGDTY